MTKTMTMLKAGTRAAMIAILLGTSAMAVSATPAAAQSSFSFKFDLGGDYSVKGGKRHYKKCLSERQIVRGIRDFGFRNVEIVRALKGWKYEVVGRYRGQWFSMRVDGCTGDVYNIKRLRNYDYGYDKKPGFGLQFNFGY